MDRAESLRKVQEQSFALIDAALFLDTHPDNKSALEYYNKCRACLKEVTAQFTAEYGPLTKEQADTANGWSWAASPWPWEGEE